MKRSTGLKILMYAFIAFLLIIYLFPLLYAVNTSLMSKLDYMKNPVAIGTSIHFETTLRHLTRPVLPRT